jgi:hypothetical protein
MLGLLLSLLRLVWLFGKGHRDVVLDNLALRQQLSIYQRKQKRPQLTGGDRWFWITVSVMWKNWRQALLLVHPDTVVSWQRERFRRHWGGLSSKPGRIGRPPIQCEIRRVDSNFGEGQPVVACAADSWRVEEIGNRGVRANGVAGAAKYSPAAFAELENLSAKPHGRDGSD